jgi:putative nucleotidyltransferase with HDIG domain
MGAAAKFSRLTTHEIVGKLDDLPTLPAVVYELNKVINDPMSSTSDVERIMANDQSMTTKVLKLANSAYYAIPGGVSSLQRAIAYIGYDTINQLALSSSIMKALDAGAAQQFDVQAFWRHSMAVAMTSEIIARELRYRQPSDLFTCGLVHDMGKVALLIVAQDQFIEAVAHARNSNLSLHEAEEAIGAPKHTAIGLELSNRWRLPYLIQACVAHHHQREANLRGGLSPEVNMVVDIVYVSNLLVHALQFGNSGHNKVLGLPKDVVDRLGLQPDKLRDLIGKIKEKLANAEAFLKVIAGG